MANDRDTQRGHEEPQMPSKDPRQPQFNATNTCRCDCTGALGGDSEGRGDPDADDSFLRGEEGADCEASVTFGAPLSTAQGTVFHFETRCADFIVAPSGFYYGSQNVIIEHPFSANPDYSERPATPESLVPNLHSSEEPSLTSSSWLTRRSHSPGPFIDEFGGWVHNYFIAPPLTLVPQLRIPLQPQICNNPVDDVYVDYEENSDSEEPNDGDEYGPSTG